ncbi:hypothetical protein [uncultured Cardiobacterium sp.]|uniref:hypothetical protein n=1 Tax=uncultured Cardiobacterium sp. TaxID=417619 RepID=UPI0026290078|nr:hypothetical protein [uncultured Cardiobacterium sp.]
MYQYTKPMVLGLLMIILSGCSSVKTYENEVFPQGEWKAVNPQYFGKTEAQRILEGKMN